MQEEKKKPLFRCSSLSFKYVQNFKTFQIYKIFTPSAKVLRRVEDLFSGNIRKSDRINGFSVRTAFSCRVEDLNALTCHNPLPA